MPVRPSLIRSIPFWILLVASAVLTGIGAWLVLSRLASLDRMLRTTPADAAGQLEQTVAVYADPPAVTAAAVVLGAGLVGLLLALTLATVRTLLTTPAQIEAVIVDELDDITAVVGSAPLTTEPEIGTTGIETTEHEIRTTEPAKDADADETAATR